MDFATFQNVIMAGTPFRTGNMMSNGWAYFDTPYRYEAHANINAVPYIVFNEEGTIYTQKNKGFISQGIVGQLNHITWSETLGLPYSYENTDKTLASRRNSMLMAMGAVQKG